MNNANICRYERELKKSVRGFRLRKQLMAEFARSLAPLLEEFPSPSYEDLVDAFGPPEHLADMLLHDIDTRPLSWRAKAALVVGVIAVIFAVGFGVSSLQNAPENGVVLSAHSSSLEESFPDGTFTVAEVFSPTNIDWNFPENRAAYIVEACNTNRVHTNIFVYYSDHQPPHTFEVPAGETRVFVVNDPRPGKHSIAFNTPDGTLSGVVRVLLSDAPIP